MAIKAKDFKAKAGYNRYEVMIMRGDMFVSIHDIVNQKRLIKEFGDLYVASFKYFDDTKTTSIILSEEKTECNDANIPLNEIQFFA